MKRTIVAGLALALALPAVTLPATASDAQVLTGASAPRRPAARPRLSEAELDRLTAAEDAIFEIDSQLADIQAAAEAAGGMTEAQQAQVEALNRRRADAQRTVDRLEAKRNR